IGPIRATSRTGRAVGAEADGRGDCAADSGAGRIDFGRVLGADGQLMNYRVIWTRRALIELTNLWIAATNRAAVTAASNRIDQRLASDPSSYGESRAESDRLAYEPPL